jgi:short-subunit dehydrogenase
MPSTQFLQKKKVLVTGASSGIGAETCKYLASIGLHVILVARREEKLRELTKEIVIKGGIADFRVCDLSLESERVKLYQSLAEVGLLPDILVNNAGIGWYGYFRNMPWDVARELLALNIEALTHLTSLFLPNMLSYGYGHIINIGSVAGKLPEQGVAIYSSTKSYLDSFTTSLYREMRGTHVTVSVLRAGPIRTEFFDAARKMENGGNIPAERFATSTTSVCTAILKLIKHPQKVVYVPVWMVFSPLLEYLFEWAVDIAGPLLLKRPKKP